jgi:hypothetical protein
MHYGFTDLDGSQPEAGRFFADAYFGDDKDAESARPTAGGGGIVRPRANRCLVAAPFATIPTPSIASHNVRRQNRHPFRRIYEHYPRRRRYDNAEKVTPPRAATPAHPPRRPRR